MSASKSGPAMWALDDSDTPSKYSEKKRVERIDKTLQVAVGQQLLDISKWAGERSRAGDTQSLKLLTHYIELILGSVQPTKVEVVIEGEEVK